MRLAWLIPVLAITACESTPKKTTAAVGPSGGVVKSGDASVTIPAGALTAEVTITVVAAPDAPIPPGVDPVGTPIDMQPAGQIFAQPITVRIPVDLNAIPVGKSLADVIIFSRNGSGWEPLATTVDGASLVRAETMRLSLFVPGVLKPGVDLSGPMDFAADVGDMSAAPVDLASASDLTDRDAMCAISYLMNTTSCSLNLSASCDGHAYQVSCTTTDMSAWDCKCSKDGVAGPTYYKNSYICTTRMALEQEWAIHCGYPM